jgi:hypothetical protein
MAGDKSRDSDGVAGGFVTVTGGCELNFLTSANLSAPAFSRRASSAGFGKKYLPLYLRRKGEGFGRVFWLGGGKNIKSFWRRLCEVGETHV